MSVTIIKETETYPRSSRSAVVKKEVVKIVESYREALTAITILQSKESKGNVRYVTGDIHR